MSRFLATPRLVLSSFLVALLVSLLVSFPLGAQPAPEAPPETQDPYLWLEEVEGERALEWAREQNERSTETLEAVPEYDELYDEILAIYDSQEKIPYPGFRGDWIVNFWQDDDHVRGILRRTTLESYRTDSPDWETVLDFDELAEDEDVPWTYGGMHCLAPEDRYCLVRLSPGGSDAVEMREFDFETMEFVEDGFFLPKAKSGVAWKDRDTLWVGTDFGEGSLTRAGYPRIVKEWSRGEPLSEARTVLETTPEDNGLWPATIINDEGTYHLIFRREDFFSGDTYLEAGDRLVRLDIPKDAEFETIFRDRLLFSLRTDWTLETTTGETTYPQGALLAADIDDLLLGRDRFQVVFEPTERIFLEGVSRTRNHLLLTTLDNVTNRLYRASPSDDGWTREEISLAGLGTAYVAASTTDHDRFFFGYQDFKTPATLYLTDPKTDEPAAVKSNPAWFDGSRITVSRHEAPSKDGTEIPYFLVVPESAPEDGTAPTLLTAYGGFEVARTPSYSGIRGVAWLARGGIFVLANPRGGGEFGPAWHQAAVQENHIRNFQDFIAVAEDLIDRGITSPEHLGIRGGSQGGLLVGGAMTLRPDLFGAVVSAVPLLDMRRYHELLAGASWMSEYGDPDDPEDWAYIKEWSPYHLVEKDADYPDPFFWTTTRDDRVHPGHARKM
ncbi:MAG: prolyl oligopeptidase family serine peptidase, partial [Thermoanaerobaculia bacterium]|nr:prolyl oligopeptidase family serine peptidase [Thermoanaerobaculia bacterium]